MPHARPLLVMTRDFAAPRGAVFADWCKPGRLARWWDPTGAPGEIQGRYHVTIVERVEHERIVFTWGGESAETRTVITVRFADTGNGTRIELEQAVPARCAA